MKISILITKIIQKNKKEKQKENDVQCFSKNKEEKSKELIQPAPVDMDKKVSYFNL